MWPPGAQSTQATSGHKPYPKVTEIGNDRPGSDFRSEKNVDGAGAYAQLYEPTKECQSWTYVELGYGQAVGCQLKNKVPGKTKISGCGDYCTPGLD